MIHIEELYNETTTYNAKKQSGSQTNSLKKKTSPPPSQVSGRNIQPQNYEMVEMLHPNVNIHTIEDKTTSKPHHSKTKKHAI